MGYRSSVEMFIEDESGDKIGAMLTAFAVAHPQYVVQLFDPEICDATVQKNTFQFEAVGWKWYSRRLMGEFFGGSEFVEVEAIEALIVFSQNWADSEHGQHHRGYFLRWGDDEDDTDSIHWGR